MNNQLKQIKLITLNDFDKMCRLCLKTSTLEDLTLLSIIGMKMNDIPASDVLNYTLGMGINGTDHNTDKLPHWLCIHCTNKLYKSFEFKEMCLKNERFLTTLVEQDEQSIKAKKIKLDQTEDKESTEVKELVEDEKFQVIKAEEPILKSMQNIELIELDQTEDEESTEENELVESDEEDEKFQVIKAEEPILTSMQNIELSELSLESKPDNFEYKECMDNDNKHGEILNIDGIKDEESNEDCETEKIQCYSCLKTFSSRSSLLLHVKSTIHSCGKLFHKYSNLKHMRSHMNPQKCHETEYLLTSPGQEDNETRTLSSSNCSVLKSESHSDFKVENSDDDSKTDTKSFSFCSGLSSYMLTHYSELKPSRCEFRCQYCKRTFAHQTQLTSHMRTHSGLKFHTCTNCGKSFGSTANLKVHMKTHEKPDICETYDEGFQHPRLLRRQHRPKKFLCSICERGFTSTSDLKLHLRTHTEEKPFMCPHCGRKFTKSENLNVHIRTHTGETPYKCKVCGEGFKDSRRHICRDDNKVKLEII